VPDNLLIPGLVAQVGGVGLHRHRVVTAMSTLFPMRIKEFPFPVTTLGYDMVWNPRLGDDSFIRWLRGLLQEAADAP
jgi:DNA-binding transcriptional LysR family regulator